MTTEQYISYFEQIAKKEISSEPYDQDSYLHYTQLNFQRFNRWMKLGKINEQLRNQLLVLEKNLELVIITEPWCGDAAHTLPFLIKMASETKRIRLSFQLRDSNSEISKYTTNGSKSIPIVIARDENKKDVFIWGPRPSDCQELRNTLVRKNTDPESIKIQLQQWYNSNKGIQLQKELSKLLSGI